MAADGDDPCGSAAEAAEEDVAGDQPEATQLAAHQRVRRQRSIRAIVFGLLPGIVMILAAGAGYLKWLTASALDFQTAAAESVQSAIADTIAMLSYQPDTVERDLNSARQGLTGDFREAYTKLINDVVIPGAQQKGISSVAAVPAAASVSASESRAVVLVVVNQTTTIAEQPPTITTSSVRVTLDKVDERWLVSQFDPV